ncbi:MAG: 1,6-anhydro-N-acetylmuramyl-L-alanine amidase AmpD [Burkholderiaceae bacterium]|nr:1,6-anhydro-N-acetylmuramyl-L-alanine amidase AmpD [Burkholderiaceae bacterium]
MKSRSRRGEWASGGWFAGARRCSSPNRGERPAGIEVELALIHSISLPPGRYGGNEIEHLFTNCLDWEADPYFQSIREIKVSAHFVVRRDGELLQFVGCDERAWHAGASAWRGRENCNDYSVGIELEGMEGERFEPAQYVCLSEVLKALARRYPISGVAGHEHVAPGRKQDPGVGFEWLRLITLLDWPARFFPEVVVAGPERAGNALGQADPRRY